MNQNLPTRVWSVTQSPPSPYLVEHCIDLLSHPAWSIVALINDDHNNNNMADSKPSSQRTQALVLAFVIYSLVAGYYAAVGPSGKWKSPFSWHPFLMMVGFVGCMGVAALTKKLGGYTNTKNHGLLANLGIVLSLGGFYAIYSNKNMYGRDHFTSTHGKAGLAVICMAIGAGMVGGIFLHPDFGMDKTNKTIRFAHKTFARCLLAAAWGTAFYGFYTLTQKPLDLALFGLPMIVLAPFTFM